MKKKKKNGKGKNISFCMNNISRKILTSRFFVSLEVSEISKSSSFQLRFSTATSSVKELRFLYASPNGQHWDVKSYLCVLPSTQAAVNIVFCKCNLVQCPSHCKTNNNKSGSKVVRTVQDAPEMAEFVLVLFCTSGRTTTGSSVTWK